jgi:hypothetical protein
VYGGSCLSPAVFDADVYIGFDHGMKLTAASWPWHADKGPVEVYFPVTDMHAPMDAVEFRNLVEWTAAQIKAGKKVHAGCIGGHGRTGTFFAALVAFMTGETDAITYVRKHYCQKAVESESQIKFLEKHYGVKPVAGSKSRTYSTGKWSPSNLYGSDLFGSAPFDNFDSHAPTTGRVSSNGGGGKADPIYGDGWGSMGVGTREKKASGPRKLPSIRPMQSRKNIWVKRAMRNDTV